MTTTRTRSSERAAEREADRILEAAEESGALPAGPAGPDEDEERSAAATGAGDPDAALIIAAARKADLLREDEPRIGGR